MVIWHEHPLPTYLGGVPLFSFHDVAQIIAECPRSYAEATKIMNERERKFGVEWYKHNAKMSWDMWQLHRPWWLV